MNETIQGLHDRKSVRAYEARDIPAADKREILLAAMAAPTAGNQQLYTILDVTDQALKDRLAVTCDNQPFIAKAPMVLIFCADLQKWVDAFAEAGCRPRRPGPGDLMLAVTDAAVAAQNAVTAAHSLGIGSCYIGDIMERAEIHRQLLALPEFVFPALMLVFGYPTAQQHQRPKPQRHAIEDIVHPNKYRRLQGPELRAMFQKDCGDTSYDDWMAAFCARKYNSDFAREMSRSVALYLQSFSPQDDPAPQP